MSEQSPENLLNNSKKIYGITSKLITKRHDLNQKILQEDYIDNINTIDEFFSIVKEVFCRIPKCSMEQIETNSNAFFLIHNIDSSIFKAIKPRIVITPLNRIEIAMESTYRQKDCLEVKQYLEESNNFSDTVIFITHNECIRKCASYVKKQCFDQCIKKCRKYLRKKYGQSFRPIIINIKDLISILDANNRINELEKLIVSN